MDWVTVMFEVGVAGVMASAACIAWVAWLSPTARLLHAIEHRQLLELAEQCRKNTEAEAAQTNLQRWEC